jgi:hypothetical protein
MKKENIGAYVGGLYGNNLCNGSLSGKHRFPGHQYYYNCCNQKQVCVIRLSIRPERVIEEKMKQCGKENTAMRAVE